MISKIELIDALKKASSRSMELLLKIEASDEIILKGSIVSRPTLFEGKPMYPTNFHIRLSEQVTRNSLTKVLYIEVPYLDTYGTIRKTYIVKIMIRGLSLNSLTYILNPDCIPGFSLNGELYIDIDTGHDPAERIISEIVRISYFLKGMNNEEYSLWQKCRFLNYTVLKYNLIYIIYCGIFCYIIIYKFKNGIFDRY